VFPLCCPNGLTNRRLLPRKREILSGAAHPRQVTVKPRHLAFVEAHGLEQRELLGHSLYSEHKAE
jgi:hypothetical protein